MSERRIYEHLIELREGRDEPQLADRTSLLMPDMPVSGRYIRTEFGTAWSSPSPSTASRLPPARSRGFCRGAMVDPNSNRALVFESSLERNLALMLMADRRVTHIQDQPEAVHYRTPDGRFHRHTFDFLATLVDGTRVAIAVKPTAKVERSGITAVLDLIRTQVPNFADRFVLRTEKHITKTRAANAQLIVRSRRGRNEDDVTAVRTVVASLTGSMRIDDIVTLSNLGGRGFNAVICLIDDGVLAPVREERIDYRTPVCKPVGGLH